MSKLRCDVCGAECEANNPYADGRPCGAYTEPGTCPGRYRVVPSAPRGETPAEVEVKRLRAELCRLVTIEAAAKEWAMKLNRAPDDSNRWPVGQVRVVLANILAGKGPRGE